MAKAWPMAKQAISSCIGQAFAYRKKSLNEIAKFKASGKDLISLVIYSVC